MASGDEQQTFELWDLRVRISDIRGRCTCGHAVGDCFELSGGQLSIPQGRSFCLYALQSTLPLLPAKQRPLQPFDWMQSDAQVHCPDPLCGVIMTIERTRQRGFRHAETSAVPLHEPADDAS